MHQDGIAHKILGYIGYGIMFIIVVCIIAISEHLYDEHRATQSVTSLEINITGGENCTLADKESIDSWITKEGPMNHNMTLAEFNSGEIERRALELSAVAEANVYVDYNGKAVLDVTLREPIARLRTDGYDLYISEDGYIMPTVANRTAAVPVITGDYTALFKPTYAGCAKSVMTDSIAALDKVIERLEDAKLPYYRQLEDNDKALRETLSESVRKGFFTSEREYAILVNELEGRKIAARERHTATKRSLEAEIEALAKQQDEARLKQSKVSKAGEDFETLIAFLKHIDDNSFWHAEVVQVMLTGGGERDMELSFVPRSGNFVVDLGTPEDYDTKLSNLYRFYNKGLDNLGWNKFSYISLRYDKQVVCR